MPEREGRQSEPTLFLRAENLIFSGLQGFWPWSGPRFIRSPSQGKKEEGGVKNLTNGQKNGGNQAVKHVFLFLNKIPDHVQIFGNTVNCSGKSSGERGFPAHRQGIYWKSL
jgi:hypothetical protein